MNASWSPLEAAAELIIGRGKYRFEGKPGKNWVDFSSPRGGDRWRLKVSGEQLSLRWNEEFEYVIFVDEEPSEMYDAAVKILRNVERVWKGSAKLRAGKTWPLRRPKFELETTEGELLTFYQLR